MEGDEVPGPMDASLFRSKYNRFERHHNRLSSSPDPARARERFPRVLRRCRHVERLRLGFYALIYLGTISAAVLAVLRFAAFVDEVGAVIKFFSALTPALAIFGLMGVLVCTRVLAFLEVDLLYFSFEANSMRAAKAAAASGRSKARS